MVKLHNDLNTQDKQAYIKPLPFSDNVIVWLSESNKYVLINREMGEVLEKIYHGESYSYVLGYCTTELDMPVDAARETIDLIKEKLDEIINGEKTHYQKFTRLDIPVTSQPFICSRYYKINGIFFHFEYENPQIEHLVHPKIACLEIDEACETNHHFQLFKSGSRIILHVDGKTVGGWGASEVHYLTGKVSMEILQKLYNNKENDWMAVFHAASISNGQESIVFLGDSGNGKSTLSAILMANGYEVLSDDFLPVESETCLCCSFPAAISIKKNVFEMLAPLFPELKNAQEFSFPLNNKTVRYLPNHHLINDELKKVPCKALIFVKYLQNAILQFNPLSKEEAFQRLVTDSWISPSEKNAKQFLNWFISMPCYQLIYSNANSMLDTVKKVFEDDL